MYPITTITTSLLACIFVYLAIGTIKLRRVHKVSVGSNGHSDLELMIRAHGNFAEYVPITLLLILCAEANQANRWLLSAFTVIFIAGRLAHAYAFVYNNNHLKYRVLGMKLTFLAIVALAVFDLILLLL